jgi:hypothetical protein
MPSIDAEKINLKNIQNIPAAKTTCRSKCNPTKGSMLQDNDFQKELLVARWC